MFEYIRSERHPRTPLVSKKMRGSRRLRSSSAQHAYRIVLDSWPYPTSHRLSLLREWGFRTNVLKCWFLVSLPTVYLRPRAEEGRNQIGEEGGSKLHKHAPSPSSWLQTTWRIQGERPTFRVSEMTEIHKINQINKIIINNMITDNT